MPSLTFDIKSDLDLMANRLAELSTGGKVNRAVTQAINNVLFDARPKMKALMEREFDRPTPYTLRSILVDKARDSQFGISEGSIFVARGELGGIKPENYISPEVYGGGRKLKRYERALQARGLLPSGYYTVPSKYMKLDAYGNVGPGIIVKILSALGALGPRTNRTERSARKLGAKKRDFYVILPNDPNNPGRQPGIYERTKTGGYKIAFIYTRAPNYKPRYTFYETLEAEFKTRFVRQLDRAITFEMNNRRNTSGG